MSRISCLFDLGVREGEMHDTRECQEYSSELQIGVEREVREVECVDMAS